MADADIATWLRDNAPPGPLGRRMVEAADEIERLRAVIRTYAAQALRLDAEFDATRMCALQTEIDHLRANLGDAQAALQTAGRDNERLRAALAGLVGHIERHAYRDAAQHRLGPTVPHFEVANAVLWNTSE